MNPNDALKVVLDAREGMLLTATVESSSYIQAKAPANAATLEVRTLLEAAVVTGLGTTWHREASGEEAAATGEFFLPMYEEISRGLYFTLSVDRFRAVIYQMYLTMPPRGLTDAGLLVRTITPAGQTVLQASVVQVTSKDGLVFRLPPVNRGR